MQFHPVDEIDFLPAGFHDRKRRHRTRGWRWAVAAAFVGLGGLGLAGNRIHHARLKAEHDRLAPQAAAVADLDRQSTEIRARIDSVGLKADLRARLRLRPATTRLLAAVTAPLPAHTTLTELHLTEGRPAAAAPSPAAPADQPVPPPIRRDLDRLDAEHGRTLVLTLRGIAPDDDAVSDYLSGLGRTELFDEVRLLFTDRHELHGHELRTFSAELRVRSASSSPAVAAPSAVADRPEGGTPL